MKILWFQAVMLSVSISALAMEAPFYSILYNPPMENKTSQDSGIEKAANQLIEYIQTGLKDYKGGPTLPRPKENDHLCEIYLNLANQFILAGTKAEDVLPVWDHLGHLFLDIVKISVKTKQQQQEYKIFKTELETHKEKNYIWYTCYMHALTTMITEPKYRHDIQYFNTHFDSYQIALNEHQYHREPAWLSHAGRLHAYKTIGSEWTRNVASTIAQMRQFPDIVFLWCPFELSPSDLVIAQPHPDYSHLSFVGFLLEPACVDGYTHFQSSFFSRHDEHHKVISDWFLSGADLVFFLKDKDSAPSLEKYWQYVREGRMIWYDCVKMFRDTILSMDKMEKPDEYLMFSFFAFWIIHEGLMTLQERINTILRKDRNNIMHHDIYKQNSLLLDPHYYFPLLPKSLQNKKHQVKFFQEEMQRYLYWFYQRIENDVSHIKEKYKNSIFLYNRTQTSRDALEFSEWTESIHFDFSPYDSETERMSNEETMLNQYGFHRYLYKTLKQHNKNLNQKRICLQYDFRGKSPFYIESTPPLFHRTIFNQDELSLKKGIPYIIYHAGWEKEQNSKNIQKAHKLYELSALAGYPEAYNKLAMMYQIGNGVQKNIQHAIQLYKIAIKKGSVAAMNHLGDLYLRDGDIEKNINKAEKYYLKAMGKNEWEKTTLKNINHLALMYKTGDGVKKNILKAIELYEIALEKKDPNAMNNLGLIYQRSEPPLQDYKKALDFYVMAIETGSIDAFNNLAIMYQMGEGVKKNIPEAIQLYKKGVEKGCGLSMNNLGSLYLQGAEGKKDPNRAIELYTMALALNKHSLKKNGLELTLKNICYVADMFFQGNEVEKNNEKAIELYKLVIEKKEPLAVYIFALHKLAVIYHAMYDGSNQRQIQNRINAINLYKKAIRHGDTIAMFNLSLLYIEEPSYKSNFLKGMKLMDKAWENGLKEAEEFLESLYAKALKINDFKCCHLGNFLRALASLNQVANLGSLRAKNILEEIHILAQNSIE